MLLLLLQKRLCGINHLDAILDVYGYGLCFQRGEEPQDDPLIAPGQTGANAGSIMDAETARERMEETKSISTQ